MNFSPSESLLAYLIHYPGCWDTACYLTVHDALEEMFDDGNYDENGWQCTNEDCPHKEGVRAA